MQDYGLGARTLTDLFCLAKVSEASGELIPLEGEDLDALKTDLEDMELLIIDEVSMVSSVLVHQIHCRLRVRCRGAFAAHPSAASQYNATAPLPRRTTSSRRNAI